VKKLIGYLVDNLVYKLIALVLACLFWYIVQAEEILEINRRIAVAIEVPKGLAVTGDSQVYRYATLRATRVILGNFPEKDIEAKISLPANEPKSYRIRLNRDYFPEFDHRIAVTVHEPNIVVNVDKVVTRTVRIKEVFKGSADEGLVVSKVELNPARVAVTGPESEVLALQHILTEPIDLDGVKGEKEIGQLALDRPTRAISLAIESTKIKISVNEKMENHSYSPVRVVGEGNDLHAVFTPEFVTLEIQGTKSLLNSVDANAELKAFVDLSDLRPGRYQKEIKVKIPSGTVFVGALPSTVGVEILPRRRLN
jgi:YbbR domain-containing protein